MLRSLVYVACLWITVQGAMGDMGKKPGMNGMGTKMGMKDMEPDMEPEQDSGLPMTECEAKYYHRMPPLWNYVSTMCQVRDRYKCPKRCRDAMVMMMEHMGDDCWSLMAFKIQQMGLRMETLHMAGCFNPMQCAEEEFKCNDGYGCVMNSWRCDGNEDCMDGSDEMDCTCPMPVLRCPPHVWKKHCMKTTEISGCGGYKGCPGMSKEDLMRLGCRHEFNPMMQYDDMMGMGGKGESGKDGSGMGGSGMGGSGMNGGGMGGSGSGSGKDYGSGSGSGYGSGSGSDYGSGSGSGYGSGSGSGYGSGSGSGYGSGSGSGSGYGSGSSGYGSGSGSGSGYGSGSGSSYGSGSGSGMSGSNYGSGSSYGGSSGSGMKP